VILISDSVIVFDRNIAIGFSTTILLKFRPCFPWRVNAKKFCDGILLI